MWNSDETTEIVRQKVLFPKDKRLCLCAERPAQSWKIDLLTKPFSTWILFRFHLSNRYYHQDLHWWYRSGRSHPKMIASLPLRTITTSLLLKKDNEKNKEFSISFLFLVSTNRKSNFAWAASIIEVHQFGGWVVTHSLADDNFHGHSPAV